MSQPEPTHLCVHLYLWVKVIQHVSGRGKGVLWFLWGYQDACSPSGVGVCGCAHVHTASSLSTLVSIPQPWSMKRLLG